MLRGRETGAALLLAVLVLAILIALVGQMVITATHNRSVSSAALSDLQNTYAARAGYKHAVLYLEADYARGKNLDTLHERWSSNISVDIPPENKTRVWVTIQDVERKVNLALVVNDNGERNTVFIDQLRRLVSELGHDDEVVDRMVDYMDNDSEGDYETGAKNKRLYNLEELLRIPDLPKTALYGDPENDRQGILEYVTLWPTSGGSAGKVNINTAPPEVLMSLHDDLTRTIADAIVAYRATVNQDGTYQDFQQISDLTNVDGVENELFSAIAGQLVVKSVVFEVHARAVSGTIEKGWLFVVERTEEEHARLASMLKNDFLWVQPPGEEEP